MNSPDTVPAAPVQERDLCVRCLKSRATCYCSQLRPFRISFQVVLLQHPLERKKTIGTARMAHLSIEGSRLISGVGFDSHPEVNQLLDDPGNHCVVLYPGPESFNLSLQGSEGFWNAFPKEKRLIVFVIDGTWPCAKTMMNRSRRLARLPQVCFTPEKESEYQIRQQPSAYCLSSIEAVHRLIEILDPAVDASILLDLFRSMVSLQIRYARLNKIRRVTT